MNTALEYILSCPNIITARSCIVTIERKIKPLTFEACEYKQERDYNGKKYVHHAFYCLGDGSFILKNNVHLVGYNSDLYQFWYLANYYTSQPFHTTLKKDIHTTNFQLMGWPKGVIYTDNIAHPVYGLWVD